MVIENLQGRRRRQTLVLWTLFYLALQHGMTDAFGLSRNPLFNGMLNRRNAIRSASIGNHHQNQQLFKHQQNYHQQQQPLLPSASSPLVSTANNLPNHVDPYISGSNSLDKPVVENTELDQIASDFQTEQKSNNLAASASSTSYTSAASGDYGAGTGGSFGSYGSGSGSYGGGSVTSIGAYGGGIGDAGDGYGSLSTGAIGSYDSAGSIGNYGGSSGGAASSYGAYGGSSYGGSTGVSSYGGSTGISSYGGSTGISSYGAGSAGSSSYGSGGGGSSYGSGGSSGSSYGLGGGASSYSVPFGGGSPSYSVFHPAQQGATKADTIHLLSSLAPSLLLSSLLIPLALALLTNTTSSLIGRKKRDLFNDYDDDSELSLSKDILDPDITLLDSQFFPTMDAMLESYSPDDGQRLADFVRQRGLLDTHNPCLEKLACLATTTNSKFKRYDILKKAIKLLENNADPDIKKRLQDGSSVGATKERNCLTKFICKSIKSGVPS